MVAPFPIAPSIGGAIPLLISDLHALSRRCRRLEHDLGRVDGERDVGPGRVLDREGRPVLGGVEHLRVAGISGVTERTVRRHVSNMVKAGRLKAVGETRARRYVLTE